MEQTPFQQTTTSSSTPPKNWLVESILVTIFCCLIFGIIGIVNATKVNAKWAAGDFTGAQEASREAGKWTKIGFFVGIGLNVIIWLVWGTMIFTMLRSGNANNYR